jgi:hypothetical protein
MTSRPLKKNKDRGHIPLGQRRYLYRDQKMRCLASHLPKAILIVQLVEIDTAQDSPGKVILCRHIPGVQLVVEVTAFRAPGGVISMALRSMLLGAMARTTMVRVVRTFT